MSDRQNKNAMRREKQQEIGHCVYIPAVFMLLLLRCMNERRPVEYKWG